jgi:hypothetical protein
MDNDGRKVVPDGENVRGNGVPVCLWYGSLGYISKAHLIHSCISAQRNLVGAAMRRITLSYPIRAMARCDFSLRPTVASLVHELARATVLR